MRSSSTRIFSTSIVTAVRWLPVNSEPSPRSVRTLLVTHSSLRGTPLRRIATAKSAWFSYICAVSMSRPPCDRYESVESMSGWPLLDLRQHVPKPTRGISLDAPASCRPCTSGISPLYGKPPRDTYVASAMIVTSATAQNRSMRIFARRRRHSIPT